MCNPRKSPERGVLHPRPRPSPWRREAPDRPPWLRPPTPHIGGRLVRHAPSGARRHPSRFSRPFRHRPYGRDSLGIPATVLGSTRGLSKTFFERFAADRGVGSGVTRNLVPTIFPGTPDGLSRATGSRPAPSSVGPRPEGRGGGTPGEGR